MTNRRQIGDSASKASPARRWYPIWFGVLVVILLETAMITPPVGIIDDVIIGSAPFVVTMLLMIAILSYWPQLALWLPRVAAD